MLHCKLSPDLFFWIYKIYSSKAEFVLYFQGEVFNFEAQGYDSAPIIQWVEYVLAGIVPPSSKIHKVSAVCP